MSSADILSPETYDLKDHLSSNLEISSPNETQSEVTQSFIEVKSLRLFFFLQKHKFFAVLRFDAMIEIEKKEKRKKPVMIQTHDILIALALLCNLCLLDIFSLSQ